MKMRICFSALTAALFLLAGVQAHAQEASGGEPAAQAGKNDPNKAVAARKLAEAEKQALDLLLADTLTDPMSAIQYQISSQIFACNDARVPRPGSDGNGESCACYLVNTRGASNGYQGQKIRVARLRKESDGSYTASGLSVVENDQRMLTACAAAGWEKRPSKLIHDQVN